MPKYPSSRCLSLLWIAFGAVFLCCSGCDLHRAAAPSDATFPHSVKSIAVVGFLPAVQAGGETGLVRSPLVGAVHQAAPVQAEVVDKMNDRLFSMMVEGKKYQFISPSQAQGTLGSLLSSHPTAGEAEILMMVGKGMEVDAVLAGYLYRWVERDGTDYGVNRPASVAFDLYLIQTSSGVILWKGVFDKTQQSLTENLFDLGTFLKAKGKWMSAEALAEMGLGELLERFPSGQIQAEAKE